MSAVIPCQTLHGQQWKLLHWVYWGHLRFFGHVARMSDSQDTFRAIHTSTRGLPKDWRRRPGRPRHTWLRTVNADLHPLNHGLNSAWRLAQDKERCRQLVETATLQPGARSWWWWSTCDQYIVMTVSRTSISTLRKEKMTEFSSYSDYKLPQWDSLIQHLCALLSNVFFLVLVNIQKTNHPYRSPQKNISVSVKCSSEWAVSSFLMAHQHNIGYTECHAIKITKKLSIYNRVKNNRNRDEINWTNR